MVIYPYTLPAIFAFLPKIVILVLSLRAERQNFQTRLFIMAVALSMTVNVVEIAGLQKLLAGNPVLVLYYAAHIMMLAVLVQLAVSVSLDRLSADLFSKIGITIYGYALLLEGLLIFTPWLVAGAESLGGYTYTRIPGPLYWIYELFVLASMLAITLLPAWGLRRGRDIAARNRCKLWLIFSAPIAILILAVIVLLHLGFRWFNFSVTAPLLVAALLAAVGYAVHHQRPIDLNFYLPGSRLKKSKADLYAKLDAFSQTIPRFRAVDALLEHFAGILECPVALIGTHAPLYSSASLPPFDRFPHSVLHNIDKMVVANEIREGSPQLHKHMVRHGVAADCAVFSSQQYCAPLVASGRAIQSLHLHASGFPGNRTIVRKSRRFAAG